MTEDACTRMELLIQADLDGELAPAHAAEVVAHLERCPACRQLQAEQVALSTRLRNTVTLHAAPPGLRQSVTATLATRPDAVPQPIEARPSPRRRTWSGLGMAVSFGGGFALAAGLALMFLLPTADGLPLTVVDAHIRALQPQHLLDVTSTDRHTVKPWFDGRLDFAPPVKDLQDAGFPLVGGRLDYLAGRPVAALVYRRRLHDINLFVWPDPGGSGADQPERAPEAVQRRGYNVLRWTRGGMVFWAVSDLDARELAEFVMAWQAA